MSLINISKEYEAGARAAVSLPFGSHPSNDVKISGRDRSQGNCQLPTRKLSCGL